MTRLQTFGEECVNPILRDKGFRKKGLQWNRKRRGFVDVVAIERDKIVDPAFESFTLSAGVFVPEVHTIIWEKSPGRFIGEVACVVRARIGYLLPHGLDTWWTLNSTAQDEKNTREAIDALSCHILPFLDRFLTLRDVYDFLKNIQGWQKKDPLTRMGLAITAYRIGMTEEAWQILIALDKWKEKAEHVRQVLFGDAPESAAQSATGK